MAHPDILGPRWLFPWSDIHPRTSTNYMFWVRTGQDVMLGVGAQNYDERSLVCPVMQCNANTALQHYTDCTQDIGALGVRLPPLLPWHPELRKMKRNIRHWSLILFTFWSRDHLVELSSREARSWLITVQGTQDKLTTLISILCTASGW